MRKTVFSFALAAIFVAFNSPLTAHGQQDSRLAEIVRNADPTVPECRQCFS